MSPLLASQMMGRASTSETQEEGASIWGTNPPGLKPPHVFDTFGTTEVVPFHDGLNLTDYLLFLRLIVVDNLVAFAGREKQIGFEAVLAGVEVVVAATQRKQLGMVAALDDAALLDH